MSRAFFGQPHVASLHRSKLSSASFPISTGDSNLCPRGSRKPHPRHGNAVKGEGQGRNAGHGIQTVSIDPRPPAQPNMSQQTSWPPFWPVFGAFGALLFLGVTRAFGASRRRREVSDLEARGVLDESRDQKDPYLEDVMANMGRVQYGDLSEDQIQDARKRRSRARGGKLPPKEEDIVIPSNHPFAKREQITLEQQELMKQRLQIKRGLPLQDLQGTRGLPGMPVPLFQPPPSHSD